MCFFGVFPPPIISLCGIVSHMLCLASDVCVFFLSRTTECIETYWPVLWPLFTPPLYSSSHCPSHHLAQRCTAFRPKPCVLYPPKHSVLELYHAALPGRGGGGNKILLKPPPSLFSLKMTHVCRPSLYEKMDGPIVAGHVRVGMSTSYYSCSIVMVL